MHQPSWWTKGLLFENCTCQLLCPAHVSFKQRCENDRCHGHWAVHIETGRFGDISIQDRNVVILFESSVLMYDGGWTERMYIDERADWPERSALEAIFSGTAGGPWETLGRFVATRLETRFVPVRYEDDAGKMRMNVPGVFETVVAPQRGRNDTGPVILSNLYNVIHGLAHILGRGTTTCTDESLDFSTKRTHGLHSNFSWAVEGKM